MRGTHAEGGLDGEGRNTGGAKQAIKSAVTPAPDEGSKPAMVRTVGMGRRGGKSRKSAEVEKKLHSSRDGPI